MRVSNPVLKVQARDEKALKLGAIEEAPVFKSNTQRRKETFSFSVRNIRQSDEKMSGQKKPQHFSASPKAQF